MCFNLCFPNMEGFKSIDYSAAEGVILALVVNVDHEDGEDINENTF